MDSFNTKSKLNINGNDYSYFDLAKLEKEYPSVKKLPFSLKIVLENLLRNEDGKSVTKKDIEALISWDSKAKPSNEISYMPARVLLQDFTGVPAVVDLAAMRDALSAWKKDPSMINPLSPSELVIDHSIQVDHFGNDQALAENTKIEFERNQERYEFLKWGQNAFSNFTVVPPSTGIVHQVNLEYLARVVMSKEENGETTLFPDTLVGTDSHTTMINGLGVLGWGVGGIEAEAVMLGQATTMLIPQVVGFRLDGKMGTTATATDLVLKITQMLREKGVVGKFVEFYGPGLEKLSLADRATISNMAPEYGATCGIFPVDEKTIDYLRLSGRDEPLIETVKSYMSAQNMFLTDYDFEASYSDTLSLDMGEVEPNIAGPKRPQDRIRLQDVPSSFYKELESANRSMPNKNEEKLQDGSIVIAAITSCTNTSNPNVMIAAGLLAKKAHALGLNTKAWVKPSLAPGSKVVVDYLEKGELLKPLESLGFYVVGFGCTTCIGNSGPLPEHIAKQIDEESLIVGSVLSGNRNFEGRVNPRTRVNYLASPPLVVAYALAGRIDIDFEKEPLGKSSVGEDVYLKDIWPHSDEISEYVTKSVNAEMFTSNYKTALKGDQNWQAINSGSEQTYSWNDASTYIKRPPFFEGMSIEVSEVHDILGARVLAVLGDSVTTDHISPAGAISKDSPAARYLQQNNVPVSKFNSYGSRRGNHEVMMRGTFANIRLRNQLVPGVEGGHTIHLPEKLPMSIFDASVAYRKQNVPLVILAGKEYGTGSSRDWAAKGPQLLGVRAVIAESFERIHRSNLIGMGILPMQFEEGQSAQSLGLSGTEVFEIQGIKEGVADRFVQSKSLNVKAIKDNGEAINFVAICRIDTPMEAQYYENGGILQYVLRNLSK